jgi:hypothetical protein
MRLVLLMSAVAALLAQDAVAAAPERRGVMAFRYAKSLSPAELEWFGRFEVVVTHDPLPRGQVEALHRRGTRLLLYEWSVAYYPVLAWPWQRTLRGPALLNTEPLRGGVGALDADAYYYDPASPEHERDRAPKLAAKLRSLGYDGVFLDTTTHESVHPAALAEYRRRHPDTPYDVAFARFLRALRRELKHGIICTNQGYRAAPHILPFVDYDLSESLITWPRTPNGFVLRPWLAADDQWNSIAFLMQNLIAPVQRDYPRVRFVHLNYVERLDEATVAEVEAIARIYDAEAFVADAQIAGANLGAAYFVDLGAPQPRVESPERKTAYRFFAHGLAAANYGPAPLRIPNRAAAAYENVATHEVSAGRTIVVPPGTAMLFRRR